MVGRMGRGVARFFERLSRLLQPFANRPFGGLSPMLDGPAGSACRMLDGLARLCRGFLYGFASLFNWPLLIRSHPERCAKQQYRKKHQMSHSNLRASSH
jgi:hypothetical protein